MGPTPFPTLSTLRAWDHTLLARYKPFYLPFCDLCCLCTFGKCDLTNQKRGACGITMAAQQSRTVLIAACIGAATHIGHSRELLTHLIEKFGRDLPINVGDVGVEVEAPVTRLVHVMAGKSCWTSRSSHRIPVRFRILDAVLKEP